MPRVTVSSIDPAMIEATARCAKQENIRNARLYLRDFAAEGTGLGAASVDYVMLFNILHAEDPLRLLREACRIVAPGGSVGVIHWNHARLKLPVDIFDYGS